MKSPSKFIDETNAVIKARKAEITAERYVRDTLKRLRAVNKPQFENLFLKERAK